MMLTPLKKVIVRYLNPRSLLIFLFATLIIRAFHILSWPQVTLGMNHLILSSAKDVWLNGISNSHLALPALPPLLLSIPSYLFNVSPGKLLLPVVLFCSVLYAYAFWSWLQSLRVSSRIRIFSCLAFLFLPYHNGYASLRSMQTLIATTLFLFVAASLNHYLVKGNRKAIVTTIIFSVLLPWVRSEYCLLLPLYLVIVIPAHQMFFKKLTFAGVTKLYSICLLALFFGALSAMSFRLIHFGEFILENSLLYLNTTLAGPFWMVCHLGGLPQMIIPNMHDV